MVVQKPVATSLIKPYLKKLVLQVHPDFFVADAVKKQHNAQTLQQLYSILNPILRPSLTATLKQPVQVSFYRKQSKRSTSKQQPMKPGVLFSHPEQMWPTIQSFFSLCEQLDVKVLPSDQNTVQDMIQQQQQQKTTHRSKRSIPPFGQEFANAFYKEQQQERPKKIEWTPSMILNEKLFMCDPSLDAQQIADKLVSWLPQLQPELWWGKLPTLYVSSSSLPSDDLAKGILILNDAMDCQDINEYLRQHLKTKLEEYQAQSSSS
ncbi:uncharacterized protein BX664DRAFT_326799, partial [Halteromyces radiatus]|uniref:uncharacterized protein n=1 Tax=Halteromyces radiatus TaxID=101107 RepID=UPI00221FB6C6